MKRRLHFLIALLTVSVLVLATILVVGPVFAPKTQKTDVFNRNFVGYFEVDSTAGVMSTKVEIRAFGYVPSGDTQIFYSVGNYPTQYPLNCETTMVESLSVLSCEGGHKSMYPDTVEDIKLQIQ
jgi:hypothetical protein